MLREFMSHYTYIHKYTHAYIIRTYIYMYIQSGSDRQTLGCAAREPLSTTYRHTYIHTYIHAYIHRAVGSAAEHDIHTYIHTYVQTYIHTYIHIQSGRLTAEHDDEFMSRYTYIHIHTYIYTHGYTQIIRYIHTRTHTSNTYVHSLTERKRQTDSRMRSARAAEHDDEFMSRCVPLREGAHVYCMQEGAKCKEGNAGKHDVFREV
jgi:hypothetical protein